MSEEWPGSRVEPPYDPEDEGEGGDARAVGRDAAWDEEWPLDETEGVGGGPSPFVEVDLPGAKFECKRLYRCIYSLRYDFFGACWCSISTSFRSSYFLCFRPRSHCRCSVCVHVHHYSHLHLPLITSSFEG